MKLDVKPEKLKLWILGAGGLGLLLRIWLYATGVDEKGLLRPGHLAHVMLWVLTAFVAVAVIWLTRFYRGPRNKVRPFRDSGREAVGSVLLAAAILLLTIRSLSEMSDAMGILYVVLGFAAVAALVAAGVSQMMRTRSHFLFYVAVCLYFVVSLVRHYQHWSSDPQLADYAFRLLAGVCLTLTAYHRGTFEVGMGRHDLFWMYSLLAVFFCCLSVDVSVDGCFYLSAGVWAFTGLSELRWKKRRRPVESGADE